ncbi:hypothetical protein, partial [Anaerosporomusa subterranea]|uniref:hypothetical protein n=1 Tax=Anaerosporomusa subterranea TaxID=1794912 RepID=UPI001E29ADF4
QFSRSFALQQAAIRSFASLAALPSPVTLEHLTTALRLCQYVSFFACPVFRHCRLTVFIY